MSQSGHTHHCTLSTSDLTLSPLHSLLLTTFCLEHRPPVVAGVVILLALRWMELEIPPSKADGKNWWNTVDPHLTFEELSGEWGDKGGWGGGG